MRPSTLLLVLIGSCAPYREQVSYSNVRVDPSRPARFEMETKARPAELAFELVGDVLDVRVARPVVCRRVLVRPVLADTTTEKTLTPVGRGTQYGLLGSAVLLGALGAAIVNKSCPTDAAAAGPGARACDPDERELQRGIGAGLLAVGAVAAGAFFVNVVRLQRERDEAVVIEDYRSESGFAECRELPMPNQELSLELADGRRVPLVTARDGHATLDLKTVAPSTAVAFRPFGVLIAPDLPRTIVDLGGTVLHRASDGARYASESCQRRCDTALSDCHAALRRQDVPPESADWICHGSEQACRDGCRHNRATAEQTDFVLKELTQILDGLVGLRAPLDARQALIVASLLERAQALRPYTQNMTTLLDAAQKRAAAQLLTRLHRSLPRLAPLLKQWAETPEQRELLRSLEVFRIGM